MQLVPLQPVPSQTVNCVLGNQNCYLTFRQLASGLFMNVAVGSIEIVGLVLCENLNRIVRDVYLGFLGDFAFYDQLGTGFDPYFTGLGDQFQLYYIEQDEIPAGVG